VFGDFIVGTDFAPTHGLSNFVGAQIAMNRTVAELASRSSQSQLTPIYRSNIAVLFTGHSISMLGTVVFNASLAWWVSQNNNSSSAIAAVLASASVPMFAANLFASFLIDRCDKKTLLIVVDVICGLSCIALSLLALRGFNQTYAMITNAILAIGYAIISPTAKSIVPSIVPKEKLRRVNSFWWSIIEFTKMMGGIVSAFFINTVGAAGAFLFNGLSFLFSAFCETKVIIPSVRDPEHRSSLKDDFAAGFSYIIKNQKICIPLILSCAFNIFSAAVPLLLPLYVSKILKAESSVFALATGLIGGGALVSSLSLALFSRSPKLSTTNDLVLLLSLCGAALSLNWFQNTAALYVSMFLYGLFFSRFNVFFTTYIQETCDAKLIGKVFSIFFMCASLFIPVGQFIFGFLGDRILPLAYPIAGVSILVTALLVLFFSRKAGR